MNFGQDRVQSGVLVVDRQSFRRPGHGSIMVLGHEIALRCEPVRLRAFRFQCCQLLGRSDELTGLRAAVQRFEEVPVAFGRIMYRRRRDLVVKQPNLRIERLAQGPRCGWRGRPLANILCSRVSGDKIFLSDMAPHQPHERPAVAGIQRQEFLVVLDRRAGILAPDGFRVVQELVPFGLRHELVDNEQSTIYQCRDDHHCDQQFQEHEDPAESYTAPALFATADVHLARQPAGAYRRYQDQIPMEPFLGREHRNDRNQGNSTGPWPGCGRRHDEQRQNQRHIRSQPGEQRHDEHTAEDKKPRVQSRNRKADTGQQGNDQSLDQPGEGRDAEPTPQGLRPFGNRRGPLPHRQRPRRQSRDDRELHEQNAGQHRHELQKKHEPCTEANASKGVDAFANAGDMGGQGLRRLVELRTVIGAGQVGIDTFRGTQHAFTKLTGMHDEHHGLPLPGRISQQEGQGYGDCHQQHAGVGGQWRSLQVLQPPRHARCSNRDQADRKATDDGAVQAHQDRHHRQYQAGNEQYPLQRRIDGHAPPAARKGEPGCWVVLHKITLSWVRSEGSA
ncbi:MAG TPA: hypothetical protein DIT01_04050 [Lentisphaeria bacterium]|nr:hypothetical protein [Lentisphaeria bacterium]